VTQRHPIAASLPHELYVEVTNRCNSLCDTCIRTHDPREGSRCEMYHCSSLSILLTSSLISSEWCSTVSESRC